MLIGSNNDVTLIDDDEYSRYDLPLNWWGPDGQWDGESSLTDEHTPGCAYLGDIVRVANVDFGPNGPSAVTLNISNGDENTEPTLGIFIGGVQVAEIIGAYTGDWGEGVDRTAEITADITGVQTVDIMFMVESDEMSSGTPFSISFTEKPPAPAEPEPEPVREAAPAAVEEATAPPATAAPVAVQTGDAGITIPIVFIGAFAAGIAMLKRKAKN